MLNSIVIGLAFTCLLVPLQGSPGPIVTASAREAALRFAVQHGLEIPTSNVAVAVEVNYAYPHAVPAKATAEQLSREAEAIARILGADVSTGSARNLLVCEAFKCRCATSRSVVLVDEVSSSNGVFIRVYSPAPPGRAEVLTQLSQVIIDVAPQEGGWIALRNRKPPGNGLLIRR